MLKSVPISLSGPVMNIKVALKLCHFDSKQHWVDTTLNMGWQYFLHNKLYSGVSEQRTVWDQYKFKWFVHCIETVLYYM